MTGFKPRIKSLLANKSFIRVFKGNRFIFVFHDISDPKEPHFSKEYSTPVSRFREQLELFQEIFEIVSLEQIVTDKNLDKDKNYAAITFDDGFYSVFKNARPILKDKKIPYAVFLNGVAIKDNQLWFSNIEIAGKNYEEKILKISETKLTNGEDSISAIYSRGKFSKYFRDNYKLDEPGKKIYMDSSDIMVLLQESVLIGSHSYDHFALGFCDDEIARTQIEDNHTLLKQLTHQTIKHFAIPFGKKKHYNKNTISVLKESGHTYIYSANPNKFNTDDLSKNDFFFPRIGITDQTPREILFLINRTLFKKYDL
jgi:peptidoglycan/xylan/chitin deacetylase (PgdA/CDA1 family)